MALVGGELVPSSCKLSEKLIKPITHSREERVGNPRKGQGPRETLELGIYLIAPGTESKQDSLRDQRTFILLSGEICYFNHLLFEPKISLE